MSLVCPHEDFRHLRSLSHEEVNVKIQQYSAQIPVKSEKEMESHSTRSEMADFSEDIELDHMDSQHGLKNIFEEYDHHLSWNEFGIYDLH
jgi:hypothetical protein